jgi:ABC-2 type transport system permease protein
MSLNRIRGLIWADVILGSRSPAVIWLMFMPFAIFFLMRVVLVTLFQGNPGICFLSADEPSRLVNVIRESGEMVMTRAVSEEELSSVVDQGLVDAGLVLQDGFEDSLAMGRRPFLHLTFSPYSDARTRAVMLLALLDMIRSMTPPGHEGTDVQVITVGNPESQVSMEAGVFPGVLLLVMVVAGIFLPAHLLVGERERGTLNALLVSPARKWEIMTSKAAVGFLLTLLICGATLILQGSPSGRVLPLLLTITAGTVFCTVTGLIYGCLARDSKTLYTMVKSLNILLVAPVVSYFVPGLPGWLPRIFPTYWFIDPLYGVTVFGKGLVQIYPQLIVTLACSILLLLPLRYLSGKKLFMTGV